MNFFEMRFFFLGDELLRSEYISEINGKYALSRVEFIASPSDNNLPLICKGQVETFPERIAAFSLNVACKLIYLKKQIFYFLIFSSSG